MIPENDARRFSPDEVNAILRRALDRQGNGGAGSVSYTDLLDTARELGIDPARLEEALQEQEEVGAIEAAREAYKKQKKQKFVEHLRSYIIVNAILIAIDVMTGGPNWFFWPLFGWGIDLAFDAVGRFGGQFPRGFTDDWMRVGADEAMHFALLDRRLRTLGAAYGDLPAHAGLWDSAVATADDPLARLAVVPTVLEARGLDVTPATVAGLRRAGDERSALILERIYRDEIRHVGAGMRWFLYGCESDGHAPVAHWRHLVGKHFRGVVKPPFNDSARVEAGLSRDFYDGLADPPRL